jgi:disulfide bond formation protein DsbB
MSLTSRRVAALTGVLLLALAGCGVSSESRGGSVAAPTSDGDPVAGAQVYLSACSSCHGSDLAGVDGLGKELLQSAFIIETSEEDLSSLILEGVPADDPSNMTGIDMSAKGGNPSLSSQDVADVAAYLKGSQ